MDLHFYDILFSGTPLSLVEHISEICLDA